MSMTTLRTGVLRIAADVPICHRDGHAIMGDQVAQALIDVGIPLYEGYDEITGEPCWDMVIDELRIRRTEVPAPYVGYIVTIQGGMDESAGIAALKEAPDAKA